MNYTERDMRYDEAAMRGYKDILNIANGSPYPSTGNGRQYVDFTVGGADSKVSTVRVLIDFRGEYFSSFFLGGMLPMAVTGPIRNKIHFTAKEAYDYIIGEAERINKTN